MRIKSLALTFFIFSTSFAETPVTVPMTVEIREGQINLHACVDLGQDPILTSKEVEIGADGMASVELKVPDGNLLRFEIIDHIDNTDSKQSCRMVIASYNFAIGSMTKAFTPNPSSVAVFNQFMVPLDHANCYLVSYAVGRKDLYPRKPSDDL